MSRTIPHLRMLLKLMRSQRGTFAPGLVFVVISMISALGYPYAIRLTIDEGIGGGQPERITTLAFVMLGLLVAEGVATLGRDYLFNLGAERLCADLRHKTFEHLLRQDISFFDRRTTGELSARLWTDIPNLQRVLGDELSDGLRFALWAIGGTALLFYTSPLLSLLVFIAVPAMVVAASALGNRVRRFSAAAQQASSETGAIAEECLAGIRTVRAFSQEPAEVARHQGQLAKYVEAVRRRILAAAALTGLNFMIAESAALIALWVGGLMIVDGRLTSGALISFILYAFLVARGYRNASTFWADGLRGLGATEWIFELLDRQPSLALHGGERPARVAGRLTFEGIHFKYPTRPEVDALAGVDLAIETGEMIAFVGRSGSGKTTLLNLLMRFYDPTRGRVLLDGRDIRQIDPSWLRSQMGMVLQEPVLFSRSIAENVRYGKPDAGDADVRTAAAIAQADGFIAALPDGYATAVGDRGVQLSGGQRQRIAIARAIVRRPPILLLDEATSALDAESESLVQQAVRRLDYRPTTVIVAHRLSTVVNVDRVVVLDAGRIVAVGTHQVLLQTCDLYRQLVETQLVAA